MRNSKLWALLKRAATDVKCCVPELHSFLEGHSNGTSFTKDAPKIHISLSRPLFLQVHQREKLMLEIRSLPEVQRHKGMNISACLGTRCQ